VFLWDARRGDLVAFESAALAARHLEPWQEVGSAVAYDAEGRQVTFALEARARRILGVALGRREVVVVRAVAPTASHGAELRAALLAALARRGGDRAALEAEPLPALVRAFSRRGARGARR
jgi:hypothetical protein